MTARNNETKANSKIRSIPEYNRTILNNYRILDVLLISCWGIVLIPVLPVIIVLSILNLIKLRKQSSAGLYCKGLNIYILSSPDRNIRKIIRLLNLVFLPSFHLVLTGRMSLVGPRPHFGISRDHAAYLNLRIPFGIISPWWIKYQTSINFQDEKSINDEYAKLKSLRYDFSIFLRAFLVSFYGRSKLKVTSHSNILGLKLGNFSQNEIVKLICDKAENKQTGTVNFINPHCVNIAFKDHDYLKSLQESEILLPDGIGIRIAGKILKSPILQNLNGTDLFPVLCNESSKRGLRIFLLGGRPGVAEQVKSWINTNYPDLIISAYHHGYFSADEKDDVIKKIKETDTDLLLVAMGVPRQEKWIYENKEKLENIVSLGVGGLFDFYSNRIPRAPLWMREIGFEWLYRLIQEPGRMWKRYLIGNIIFLWKVIFRIELKTGKD